MRKFLLFILFLSINWLPVSATHLMGGEMTVEHLNGNTYVIHFQAYRDTIGIPFALTANFEVYDNTNTLIISDTVTQLPLSGNLMPGYPYGVEVYFFHDTIIVPGPGEYTVRWFNCCRNAAIQNLSDPLNENMFLSTTFTNVAGATNSTPEFLAPPVTFLPVDQPWQYNSLPFDVDGDSMVWSIDTPLTTYGVYAAGWVSPSAAIPADDFTIDPITGQISWTPNMLGNFVASIRVEEFNNGIKVGEIIRDYQMIVIPDTTKSPRISNFNNFPIDPNGHAYMDLISGKPVNIIMLAEDPEGDQVEFIAYGEPLLLNSNPAMFTTQAINTTDVEGIFTWTPDLSQVRPNPYIVVFRTRDQLFSFDETVLFYVDQLSGIVDGNDYNAGEIYPNPTTNIVMIPLELEKSSQVSVNLRDINGRLINEFNIGELHSGSHLEKINLNVGSGTYFLTLFINGKDVSTKKVVLTD